jgi:cellulose synthase/poly-beta-1,6-N-acetylglucosamine synthase-like glycosyltransferase
LLPEAVFRSFQNIASIIFMWAFYLLATVVLWLGLNSLRGGVRFARYVRSELAREYPEFTPFVNVFAPCRGLDQGLVENIQAILGQDYPAFEVIFVSDQPNDAAIAVIERLRSEQSADGNRCSARVVIAGPASDSGQKVHNLRMAVSEADPKGEVFAFVDSDARPHANWLRLLVSPLQDATIGASTGYRWFVPVTGGVASHLRSVWNASIASALGERDDKNFCWGGATAIRRETFDRLNVAEAWRGAVSDDFAMTRALHDAGRPIKFVPQCLTTSFEDCTLRELAEFTTRQLKITRAYAAHLWKGVLAGSLLFVLVFFGGIALVITRAALGLSFAPALALLLVVFALGAVKSLLRLRAVRLVISDSRLRSVATKVAHLTLWPLASLLYLYNALAAAISRRITWRGITYELKSPTETVIIRDDR